MENASIRLNYLNEAHSTVQQDIALTVRATEKAVADVDKAQQDKLKQVRIIVYFLALYMFIRIIESYIISRFPTSMLTA